MTIAHVRTTNVEHVHVRARLFEAKLHACELTQLSRNRQDGRGLCGGVHRGQTLGREHAAACEHVIVRGWRTTRLNGPVDRRHHEERKEDMCAKQDTPPWPQCALTRTSPASQPDNTHIGWPLLKICSAVGSCKSARATQSRTGPAVTRF